MLYRDYAIGIADVCHASCVKEITLDKCGKLPDSNGDRGLAEQGQAYFLDDSLCHHRSSKKQYKSSRKSVRP